MGDPGMSVDWPRRYYVIVRDADKAAAKTKYANIDTDGTGDLTFDYIPLARTATPTVTVAWATNTLVTLAMIQRYGNFIQDMIDAGKVKVYRIDDGTWTVAGALADAWPGGLVVTQGV